MKFQHESLEGQLIVQRYDEEGVVVNEKKYSQSLIFGADLQPVDWQNTSENTLNLENCEWLYNQCPAQMEVLLIGTGKKQVFPNTPIRRFFAEKKCPVEYMDTQAACRTYNILVGEGRQVIAALLI